MAKKIKTVTPPVIKPGSSTSGVDLGDGIKHLGTINPDGPDSEEGKDEVEEVENTMIAKHKPLTTEPQKLVKVIVDGTYKGHMQPGIPYDVSEEAAEILLQKQGVTIVE